MLVLTHFFILSLINHITLFWHVVLDFILQDRFTWLTCLGGQNPLSVCAFEKFENFNLMSANEVSLESFLLLAPCCCWNIECV